MVSAAATNNKKEEEQVVKKEDDVQEEIWDLPSDFDLYATHEIKRVRYPSIRDGANPNGNNADHSFRIECIEPDTPLDINNQTQSSSQYDATGHCVWAGAFLLVRCIREIMEKFDLGNERSMIEFGCGTGVGGLAVMLVGDSSIAPSSVHFTDNDPAALEVCERNCKLNDLPESSYTIAELTWGEDGDEMDGAFDIALATDVLYDVDLIDPLFTTVSRCIPSKGIFILSHIPRACYNEGNPPEAVEDLEKYIIDQAVKYNLHLADIVRPPKEDNFQSEMSDWCPTSFVGGGILVFRRS